MAGEGGFSFVEMMRTVRSFIFIFCHLSPFFVVLGTDAQDKFKPGLVLYEDNYLLNGEYTETEDGNFFVRDEKQGRAIPKDKVKGIVTQEYYDLIQKNTRWKATAESVYLFSSSNEYQFEASRQSPNEELITRIVKVSLIALTGYYFNSSLEKNRELSNSFFGLNSDHKKAEFNREYRMFQICLTATALTYIGSGVYAYVRFGRDENFNQLNLRERQFTNIESLSVTSLMYNSPKFEVGYTKKF